MARTGVNPAYVQDVSHIEPDTAASQSSAAASKQVLKDIGTFNADNTTRSLGRFVADLQAANPQLSFSTASQAASSFVAALKDHDLAWLQTNLDPFLAADATHHEADSAQLAADLMASPSTASAAG